MTIIQVVDYSPDWPETFDRLKAQIWPVIYDVALSIEHVGSTSVPGLAAKPIIDLDIVVATQAHISAVIKRLVTIGYRHRGNLGIEGREAFSTPPQSVERPLVAHHLYACWQGSLGLKNHLAVRDYLRANPNQAQAYGALKKQLAQQFPKDMDSYIAGKTEFILEILQASQFSSENIEAIGQVNRGEIL